MTGTASTIDWAALAALWTLVGAGYLASRRGGRSGDDVRKPPFVFEGNELRPWAQRGFATIGVIPAGIAIVVDAPGKLWWWLLSPPMAVVVGAMILGLYGTGWYAYAVAAPEERRVVWAVAALFALALAAIPIVVGVLGPQKRWALAAALALDYLIFNAVRLAAKPTDMSRSSA